MSSIPLVANEETKEDKAHDGGRTYILDINPNTSNNGYAGYKHNKMRISHNGSFSNDSNHSLEKDNNKKYVKDKDAELDEKMQNIINYALDAINDKTIRERLSVHGEIIHSFVENKDIHDFDSMFDFKTALIAFFCDYEHKYPSDEYEEDPYELLDTAAKYLYEAMKQYSQFACFKVINLTKSLSTTEDNKKKKKCSCSSCKCSCSRCYHETQRTLHVEERSAAISGNAISLKCKFADDDEDDVMITLTKHNKDGKQILSMIKESGDNALILRTNDKLVAVNDISTETLGAMNTFDLLMSIPLLPSLTITFKHTQAKCSSFMDIIKCKKCKKKEKKKDSGAGCIDYLLKWFIKFLKLSKGIMGKWSAIFDMFTDCNLLLKAWESGTTWLMMALFLSLIAPYVLSYSSGIQIFNHRGTFENVQPFTFKALLLIIYLFPTGVLYWIFLDIIDILLETYKWFAFGLVGKIKTQTELVILESDTAEYFGLSRMDWLSFKRQKVIAQLYFETIPQLILQGLLLTGRLPGAQLSTITPSDLLLSVSSAILNSGIGTFEIKLESKAVREGFLQYALNCITSRFGWVPFKHIIDEFDDENHQTFDEESHATIIHVGDSNAPTQSCVSCCKRTEKDNKYQFIDSLELNINYKMPYKLPLITYLSKKRAENNNSKSFKIGCKMKESDAMMGSVPYDFSTTTIHHLITSIESMKPLADGKSVKILFGESLRLLDVRDIIHLMQACSTKRIQLPDIHKIDWKQAFSNSVDSDPRLLSHTFDEEDRSLLISVYLTIYNAENYKILREFVSIHDVPINTRDAKGDTIMHHMIKRRDYDGAHAFLESLTAKQRFNFDAQNDDNKIVMHELVRCFKSDGLKMLLKAIKPTQFINFNLEDYSGDTILHVLAKQNDFKSITILLNSLKPRQLINFGIQNKDGNTVIHEVILHNDIYGLKDILKIIKRKSLQKVNICAFNERGQSVMYLALEKDRNILQQKKNVRDIKTKPRLFRIKSSEIDDMMQMVYKFQMKPDWINLDSYTVANIMNILAMSCCSNNTFLQRVQELNSRSNDVHEYRDIAQVETHYKASDLMHTLIMKQFPIVLNVKISANNPKISSTPLGYILEHFDDFRECFDDLVQFHSKSGASLLSSEYSMLLYLLYISDYALQHLDTFDKILRYCKGNMEAICDTHGNNPIHQCVYAMKLETKHTGNIIDFDWQKFSENSVKLLRGIMNTNNFSIHDRLSVFEFLLKEDYESDSIQHDIEKLSASSIILNQHKYGSSIYSMMTKLNLLKTQRQHVYDPRIKKLNIFCAKYPEWLSMENENGDIPLCTAINNKDIDAFACIYRFMMEHKLNMSLYFDDREFIERMIEFASSFLQNEDRLWIVELLLAILDYDTVFKWSADSNAFNRDKDAEDISLVKHLTLDSKLSDIHKLLFSEYENETCTFHKENLLDLNVENNKNPKKGPNIALETDDTKEKDYNTEPDDESSESDDTDTKINEFEANLLMPKQAEKPQNTMILNTTDRDDTESVNWIEILYTTIVETCSALDLYSDIVILIALYNSNNEWWATTMLTMLCAPYLVSYGSLVVLLRKKIGRGDLSCCKSFAGYLLITPISLLYLFLIDLLFVVFTLISTVLFLFVVSPFVCIKNGCVIPDNLNQYDGRDWMEKKIFQKLQMNYTEIQSYRRLRTLAQLFFETIPQIMLQMRIMSDIKWAGNENELDYDRLSGKLSISITLAIAHLILEGGMIWFDKCVFEMGFMQYAIVSLGGKILWVPFQHFINKIVKYQIYIHRDGDFVHFDANHFNADSYKICLMDDNRENERSKVSKLLSRDYEHISTKIFGCIPYQIDYQFSAQAANTLAQKILNAPSLLVPPEFALSTTNEVIPNLMRHLLCRAEIKLGNTSCKSMDLQSLCVLYKASLYKMKLNIKSIDVDAATKLINDCLETTPRNVVERMVKSNLIAFGETAAIRWIHYDLSYTQQAAIKLYILHYCSSEMTTLRLHSLQNCYGSDCYIGKDCTAMLKLNQVILECHKRSKQEESWYFVIIFLLLYSRGLVFDASCLNGCCSLSHLNQIRNVLFNYVPTYIKLDACALQLPFQVFEQCRWSRKYIESILVDNCKTHILYSKSNEYILPKEDQELQTIAANVSKCTLIRDSDTENPFEQLDKKINVSNIAYWDFLFVALQLNTNYKNYLAASLKYRIVLQDDHIFDTSEPETIFYHNYFYKTFTPKELLPQSQIHQKYQVYQWEVSVHIQLEDLDEKEFHNIVVECVKNHVANHKKIKNKMKTLVQMLDSNQMSLTMFIESKVDFISKLKTNIEIPYKKCIAIYDDITNTAAVILNKLKDELRCSIYLYDDDDKEENIPLITDYSTIYLWHWRKSEKDVFRYALDCYNQKLLDSNLNPRVVIRTNVQCTILMNIRYIKLYSESEQSKLSDKSAKPLHRFTEDDVSAVIEHWVINDVVYQKNLKAMMQLIESHSPTNISELLSIIERNEFIKNDIGTLTHKYAQQLHAKDDLPTFDPQEIANAVCGLSLNKLLETISDNEKATINGKNVLEFYLNPKTRNWIKDITGWKSHEIYQIEAILLKNETPTSDVIIRSIEKSLSTSKYKDDENLIANVIKIFEQNDVEELYLKIRNAFDITAERRYIYNKILELHITDSNALYSCISAAFSTNVAQVKRVHELKIKRLSSLAVAWKCGNCGCDNHGFYVKEPYKAKRKLKFNVDRCLLCDISEKHSILMQFNATGIYVQQNLKLRRAKDEHEKELYSAAPIASRKNSTELIESKQSISNATHINIECPVNIDELDCSSVLRLTSVLESYQKYVDKVDIETDEAFFDNRLFREMVMRSADYVTSRKPESKQETMRLLELLTNDFIDDIRNDFFRKGKTQWCNMMSTKSGMKKYFFAELYGILTDAIKDKANEMHLQQYLKDVDIQQAEDDFHHILQYHINGETATQTTKQTVFEYFKTVIECKGGCKSMDLMRDSRSNEKEKIHASKMYAEAQLDEMHAYLLHKKEAEHEEKAGKYIDSQKHSSYGFGTNYDDAKTDPGYKYRSMKNELYQFDKTIISHFENTIIKSINKAVSEHFALKLKCSEYDPMYNIVRNTSIGVQHMFVLVMYCDFTKFCTAFRKTYRENPNAEAEYREFYHVGRTLRECIKLFGTPMDEKMSLYHGLSCKLSFSRFTAHFFQPISTTVSIHIAQQFCQGEGMILRLKPTEDKRVVPKYIEMQAISSFPNEEEFLFHGALFAIEDIITANPQYVSRRKVIRMFNLLQKTIKNKPTQGEWKRAKVVKRIDDFLTLINKIAISNEHEMKYGVNDDELEMEYEVNDDECDTKNGVDANTLKLLSDFCKERKSTIYIQSDIPLKIRQSLLYNEHNQISFIRLCTIFMNAKKIILKDISLEDIESKVDDYCKALKEYVENKIDEKHKKLMWIVFEIHANESNVTNEIYSGLAKMENKYTDNFKYNGLRFWSAKQECREDGQYTFVLRKQNIKHNANEQIKTMASLYLN